MPPDLGPETAGRVRARLAEGSFERNMEELGVRLVVAEEVERSLAKSPGRWRSRRSRGRR